MALEPVKARVAELKATIGPADAHAHLALFNLEELKPLMVL